MRPKRGPKGKDQPRGGEEAGLDPLSVRWQSLADTKSRARERGRSWKYVSRVLSGLGTLGKASRSGGSAKSWKKKPQCLVRVGGGGSRRAQEAGGEPRDRERGRQHQLQHKPRADRFPDAGRR